MFVSTFVRRAPQNLMRFGRSATTLSRQAVSPMPRAVAFKQMGGVRHAGAGCIGAGMAMTGVGGACIGIGNCFAALVVGMARNPGMQNQLMVYCLMGVGIVEFMGLICIGVGGASFASD